MEESLARNENARQEPEQFPESRCFDQVVTERQLFDQLAVQLFFQGFLEKE